MKHIALILALTFWGHFLIGQSNNPPPFVIQDNNITHLTEAFISANQNHRGMEGFRVQVYTDSGNRSKLRTDRIKAEFDAKYPHIRSYISFDEPYYKLRVGDFRTRMDAYQFLNQVSSTYLESIIVVDRINYPRIGRQDAD